MAELLQHDRSCYTGLVHCHWHDGRRRQRGMHQAVDLDWAVGGVQAFTFIRPHEGPKQHDNKALLLRSLRIWHGT